MKKGTATTAVPFVVRMDNTHRFVLIKNSKERYGLCPWCALYCSHTKSRKVVSQTMKKILAFLTSLSMCFSLLTALSPASAYADDATGVSVEETIEMKNMDPEKDGEIFDDLYDTP